MSVPGKKEKSCFGRTAGIRKKATSFYCFAVLNLFVFLLLFSFFFSLYKLSEGAWQHSLLELNLSVTFLVGFKDI